MKRIHSDSRAGIIFSSCNALLYFALFVLDQYVPSLNHSLAYYRLTFLLYFLYPLLLMGVYFGIRRKRSYRFSVSAALSHLCWSIPIFFTSVSAWYSLIKESYFLTVCYLPILVDLLIRIIFKRRAKKSASPQPIGEEQLADTEPIEFQGTDSPITRGILYAGIYLVVNWIVFVALIVTPFYESALIVPFFAFGWLCSIPLYYWIKQDCSCAYLISSLISLLVLAVLCFVACDFLYDFLPHTDGFLGGVIYLAPLIGLPLYGFLPILIDAILSMGKFLNRVLGERERQR